MKEALVNALTARVARKKGFDWDTTYYYAPDGTLGSGTTKANWNQSISLFSTPTQSLLQKWLREKHKIYVTVNTEIYTLKHGYEVFVYEGDDSEPTIYEYKESSDDWDFETYEAALESALYLALQQI